MINVKTSQGNIIIKFFLTVTLDNIDRAILESLKNSRRGRTASQIYAILEYNGIQITIALLRERLRRLAAQSVISVEKGKRSDRYSLLLFNIAYVS